MPKIQDLAFILVFLLVACPLGRRARRKNSRLTTIAGLACLVLAMPLFGFKIMLFTAERLTWYAAFFFLYTIILLFINELKS